MLVKDTHSFKIKASVVHNGLYDYSLVNYVSCRVKVDIICKKHGKFQKTPEKHLEGAGCQKCSYELTGRKLAFNKEQFITKSCLVHNNKYDYSNVIYKNNSTKVDIICSKHGVFSQSPSSHMAGFGCARCSYGDSARDLESFKLKASRVHNNIYSYDNVLYKNNHTKVEINCPAHGIFKQLPANHLQGQGCPKCAKTGIAYNSPSYLYVINYEHLTKVGISNSDSRPRLKNIIAHSKLNFKELKRYQFTDGYIASEIEKYALKWLRNNYHNTSLSFDGKTECFEYVDVAKLLNTIEQRIEGI